MTNHKENLINWDAISNHTKGISTILTLKKYVIQHILFVSVEKR
jgi:hypothetical protein